MVKLHAGVLLLVFMCGTVSSTLDSCVENRDFQQFEGMMIAFRQEIKQLNQKNAIQEEETKLHTESEAHKSELSDFHALTKAQSIEIQKLRALTNTLSETLINQDRKIESLKASKEPALMKADDKSTKNFQQSIKPLQKSDTIEPMREGPFNYSNPRYKRFLLGEDGEGVAFSVTLTRPETTNLGQGQTIVFDNVVSNLGNAYDKTIGVFRVPVQGWYVLSLTLMSSPQETQELEVKLNGSPVFHCYTDGNEYNTASRTMVVHANIGDDVTVQTAQWQHSDKVHGYGHTSFTGFLLYADINS